MNNTLNLQGERLGLFNPITGLDNKSFAKVKKNVKRLIHDLQRGKNVGLVRRQRALLRERRSLHRRRGAGHPDV